jgi:hypothetical protein
MHRSERTGRTADVTAPEIHLASTQEQPPMDVNLRKTATDTAYVVVGVGVLGFQQAQVKRRDAVAKVSALAGDAKSTLSSGTGSITDSVKTRVEGCAATVGTNLGSLGTSVSATVGSAVDAVGSQVKAGADVARTVDPRSIVEPVVGDLKVRVEPVVEQLRTISLPGTVAAIPDQVAKTIEVGKARVQGVRNIRPAAKSA